MERALLLEKLNDFEKDQKTIVALLTEIHQSLTVKEGLDSLIDPLDLSNKLHISDRSLRRLKKAGILTPCTLGNRDYYLESHVMQALKDSLGKKK